MKRFVMAETMTLQVLIHAIFFATIRSKGFHKRMYICCRTECSALTSSTIFTEKRVLQRVRRINSRIATIQMTKRRVWESHRWLFTWVLPPPLLEWRTLWNLHRQIWAFRSLCADVVLTVSTVIARGTGNKTNILDLFRCFSFEAIPTSCSVN